MYVGIVHCRLCIVHCAVCIVHCVVFGYKQNTPSRPTLQVHGQNNTPLHAKCMALQQPLEHLMLIRVTCLIIQLLLRFNQVDEDFELMELLSCSKLHLWCISEELRGGNLLNVAIPEHLS